MAQQQKAGEQAVKQIMAGVADSLKRGAEEAKLEAMVHAVMGSPELMKVADEFAQRTVQASLNQAALREKVAADPLSWRAHALLGNVVEIARVIRQKIHEQTSTPSPLERWVPPEGAAQ